MVSNRSSETSSMASQLSPSSEFSIMSAASVTTSYPRARQAFSKINDLKSGMSFDSAVSMPRNCVVTTACEGKGIPSAPPENSLNSSSSSTDISQAWQSPSLVERFQAQLNCAPLPMSLHNKDANKNAASVKQPKTRPTQRLSLEKMVKTTFSYHCHRHTQHVRLQGPEPRWSDIIMTMKKKETASKHVLRTLQTLETLRGSTQSSGRKWERMPS